MWNINMKSKLVLRVEKQTYECVRIAKESVESTEQFFNASKILQALCACPYNIHSTVYVSLSHSFISRKEHFLESPTSLLSHPRISEIFRWGCQWVVGSYGSTIYQNHLRVILYCGTVLKHSPNTIQKMFYFGLRELFLFLWTSSRVFKVVQYVRVVSVKLCTNILSCTLNRVEVRRTLKLGFKSKHRFMIFTPV